ncbi:type II secretion system F family protein [Micromonospora sp. WMMD1082]|uniref:type II secretion system F family protein n=1 Tax=Micromonospora sp. WMMD1082 TaxID=3016104 RepID=UPI002416F26B|nr:type II secretion system F family protein [Micromonospora sp. WMMD1082]MDG4795009.1 type II secretion system F family protein [Micromonospora sp. WMMD1082]
MSMVLACGLAAGLGLVLVATGLMPARPSLAQALDALRRAPAPAPPPAPARARLLSAPLRALGLPGQRMRADLAVLERPAALHLADQMLAILAGLLLPPVAMAVLATGGVSFAAGTPVWASLVGAGGGWWLAESTVRAEAQRRRDEMRYALSAVLDLVVISLAGGAGLEQALDDACADARGWAAQRLRRAVDTARLLRVPPWQELGQLGADTGVIELEEVAAALGLAGTEGARIRASLTIRAATLRAHQGTALEAKANAATERMSMPVMLLAAAYLLFLLYPAVAVIDAL